MANYTEITLKEAQEILKFYGDKIVKKCTPLSLGISNSNYRVDLEDEVVLLKISNDKNHVQLADEQAILVYLNEKNYPYSLKPFPLSNGEFTYNFGHYFGVLFPFVDGITPGPSDFTCQEVGRAIAELHTIKHDAKALTKLRPHEAVGFGPKEILDYVQSPECPSDFKSTFETLHNDRLDGFINANFETGVIHGDLYYDNTLFDCNKISAVLDFEQAGIGEYILDLGISISGTCLEKGRIITPLVNSYLVGYESVRALTQNEKKFLDQAITLGLLSISLWRIRRFFDGDLNPLMKDSYQDLLVRALHYFEMKKELN